MALFQKFCADVPLWNQDVIDVNIGVILDNCRCDYVEELMTAVFIAHTKMLTAIRVNSRQKKLQITLPKLDHFLHRVFVECARAFWKAPFLFADELAPIERQKNILQAEVMCTEALSGAVRSLLPVKSILRDYLEDDEETDETVEQEKPVKTPVEEADAEPMVAEPMVAEPMVAEPVVAEPVVAEPVVAEPVVIEEKPVAAEVKSTVVEEKPVEIEEKPVVVLEIPAEVKSEDVPESKSIDLKTVTVEKLESSPLLTIPSPSSEKTIEMTPKVAAPVEKANETVVIDTVPSVHFTPYDTVFDETTSAISEIRYTPKEDKSWDDAPKLSFGTTSSALELSEMVDLESDVDTPLTSTSDFEILA